MPYGHACAGCVRAKCKCIVTSLPGSLDVRCERCRRLDKDCAPSPNIRGRNAKQNVQRTRRPLGDRIGQSRGQHSNAVTDQETDRTAQLERKLDRLMDMLASQSRTTAFPSKSTSPLEIPSRTAQDDQTPEQVSAQSPDGQSCNAQYLDQFRAVFLPACPFIHLGPETT